jgi:hypothetical protein
LAHRLETKYLRADFLEYGGDVTFELVAIQPSLNHGLDIRGNDATFLHTVNVQVSDTAEVSLKGIAWILPFLMKRPSFVDLNILR